MQSSGSLRRLDRGIGKWCCLFLSLVHLRPLRGRSKSVSEFQNVLLIELFEMGASIMIAPSILELKQSYPNVQILVLTTKTCLGSWTALGITSANNIFVLDDRGLRSFFISVIKVAWALKTKSIDLILDYGLFTRATAILSGIIKARCRASFHKFEMEGLYRGSFQDVRVPFNQNVHIALNFFALTKQGVTAALREQPKGSKFSLEHVKLRLPLYQAVQDIGILRRRFLKKFSPTSHYVVISPDVGANLSVRNYPQSGYRSIIEKILMAHLNVNVVLVGTRESFEMAEEIAKGFPENRCVNLCGLTSFEDLLDLISGAKLTLSNDNGIAHFAGLTRTKSVAIFSTDSPYMYGPIGDCVIAYSFFHCSPCISAFNHKNSSCENSRCLKEIPPDFVYGLVHLGLMDRFPSRTINGKTAYLLEDQVKIPFDDENSKTEDTPAYRPLRLKVGTEIAH